MMKILKFNSNKIINYNQSSHSNNKLQLKINELTFPIAININNKKIIMNLIIKLK